MGPFIVRFLSRLTTNRTARSPSVAYPATTGMMIELIIPSKEIDDLVVLLVDVEGPYQNWEGSSEDWSTGSGC